MYRERSHFLRNKGTNLFFSLSIDIKKEKSVGRKRGKRKKEVRTNIANIPIPYILLHPSYTLEEYIYTFMGEIYVTYTLSKAGNC